MKVKGRARMLWKWSRELWRNYAIPPGLILKNILWRRPRTVSQEDHVFIVAAPRSGTTLIQAILNAHPQTLGFDYETSIFTSQNIFNKSRYTRVLSEREIDRLFETSTDVVDFFDKFTKTLADGRDAKIIEKTPHHITRLGFILKHFPRANVLHVYRDGRDAYCSARAYQNIKRARDIGTYARYWAKCIASRRKHGNHPKILDMSYEEFTKSPESSLKKVLHFIGLDYQPGLLDANTYGKYYRAANPNFKKLSEPINTSSLGRWRTELTSEEVARFEKVAGHQLQALGYPLSTEAASQSTIRKIAL